MGRVVEKYDLADGRRLELDAGPFYRNGVEIGACWFLMNRYHTICALEHEEVIYESCESNAQRATPDGAMSGESTTTGTSNSHAHDGRTGGR